MILTLPDTYTGVTLQFLKKSSYYPIGTSVLSVGIGDWNSDATARAIIHQALGRVRVVVANMKEYMKVYRPDHSWLKAFTAFRLPSPLAESASGADPPRKAEAMASLRRICREASLPEQQSCDELLKLLPRAEKFHRDAACPPRAAWARASAEWPELQSARRLVELCIVWKTATGNLERRFRRCVEIRCAQRPRLLDITVENCMIVEQAPPSKTLLQDETLRATYLHRVLKVHRILHGSGGKRRRLTQRRDAGVPRTAASASTGPTTEAAFGRKRAAAIAEVVAESPSKRARRIDEAPPGLASIARETAEEIAQRPTAASAVVIEKVAQRAAPMKERFLRGAVAAAKGRAKRERTVVRSNAPTRRGCIDRAGSSLRPGVMLVRLSDQKAVRKAQSLRFHITSDPVDFAKQVADIPRSQRRGNVVLAPPASTDFSVCGAVAAALMGCFYAAPKDFLSSSPRGITYQESYSDPTRAFHVAVSADLAQELPTLPGLLRGISQAPGSRLCYYLAEKKLQKVFKKNTRNKGNRAMWRVLQTTCVLSQVGQAAKEPEKVRALYITPQAFLLRHEGKLGAGCPACPGEAS